MVALASSWWIVVPLGIAAAWAARSASSRRKARERLYDWEQEAPDASARELEGELWGSWLEGWLAVSGFRSPSAPQWFLLFQAGSIAVGILLVLIVTLSGVLDTGILWLEEIPGGLGDLLAPILAFAPWTLLFLAALLPLSRVRSRRRYIVQNVERDLPMALALLATLAESGLGLDASMERVIRAIDPDRPLARELTMFQSESRAGIPRVQCFRRLSRRLDVPSVSVFVSALIHAEQVGGGVAEGLRRQADEVWERRRELAIQKAQTLPTRLAVPLVLCFLPGVFVYTFGPALAQFIRIAEGVVRGSGAN